MSATVKPSERRPGLRFWSPRRPLRPATSEVARTEINSPEVAQQFLIGQLQHGEHEYFCVLYLDTRHGVIAFNKMFRGTIDGSAVHPREVVKAALSRNAAAVILAHNPSGVPNRAARTRPSRRGCAKALRLWKSVYLTI